MSEDDVWIGVDFDGTLAEYHGWRGIEHLGDPIPLMVTRVKEGIRAGRKFKIFTARAANGPRQIELIEKWCLKHLDAVLEVTNVKDYSCIEIWDARCRRVQLNTGMFLDEN